MVVSFVFTVYNILIMATIIKSKEINRNIAIDNSWDFKGEKTKSHTHCFHTYPAMFIPQVARRLLQEYSKKNDTVCDIFCGSGTALVESKLLNRNSYGIELNPLAAFIAAGVGLLVARHIQERQFKNEDRKEKQNLKAILETLKDDVFDYHSRLKKLGKAFERDIYPVEHFNLSNKDAIWPQIIKTDIFVKNRKLFGRINRMSRRLMIINKGLSRIQEIELGIVSCEIGLKGRALADEKSNCKEALSSILKEDIVVKRNGTLKIKKELNGIINNI